MLFISFSSSSSAVTLTESVVNNTKDNYRLPAVPYPIENQHSEEKRILGKILFWDEQLSTDNSIACGSCHLPSSNGADSRIGIEAGFDKTLNTKDDILGSLGVVARNSLGEPIEHPIYQTSRQVTSRSAQPYFLGLWANTNFWDGRAGSQFISPENAVITIRSGGALENQALGPLMSHVEMAKNGQTAQEVISKLEQSRPLALASNLPKDIVKRLNHVKGVPTSYPDLFADAFTDSSITLTRIAFAIATYERSLIANQTPWDLAIQGKIKLGFKEKLGFEFFKQNGCAQCHKPPLFTDNKFYNIGIQGRNADKGRQLISSNKNELGAMKTPSLRNVALKKTFMHTGQLTSLEQVIDAYADVPFKQIATKLPNGEKYDFQFTETQRKALIAFMTNALTDARVKNEEFPFDRPTLRSELTTHSPPIKVSNVTIKEAEIGHVYISWQTLPPHLTGYDIEIVRNDGRHYWASQSPFIDIHTEAGNTYEYQLFTRNALGDLSTPIKILVEIQPKNVSRNVLILLMTLSMLLVYIIKKS